MSFYPFEFKALDNTLFKNILGTNGYNLEVFRSNAWQKLKPEPYPFDPLLAEPNIFFHFGITVRHAPVCMSNPEPQQVFGHTFFPKPSGAESSEGMETTFL